MTIQECYAQIGGDFQDVFGRFGSEGMVQRFAGKFLKDTSFQELKEGIENGDGEKAFRAAHTMKGICMNLGFHDLYEVSAALTEKLRGGQLEGSGELFAAVQKQYERVVEGIRQLES